MVLRAKLNLPASWTVQPAIADKRPPVKILPASPDAQALPALDEAIAAFREELKLDRLGIVHIFHSPSGRIAVYGCKIAVELGERRTLHFRMRPLRAPWLLTAELIAAWPEVDSHVRLRDVDQSWLELALVNMFEAWCDGWLPDGYRYIDSFAAVTATLAEFLNDWNIARRWQSALMSVLPPEFCDVFGLIPVPWANLRVPAAPFRIWNHHADEIERLPSVEPWLREIIPMLRYFPADLTPGLNLLQSIRLMVVERHSATVWRFHRGSKFALVPDSELLFHPHSGVGAAIVTNAIVVLGIRNAAIFLLAFGAGRFRRICAELNESDATANWRARLPLLIARGAGRLNQAKSSVEREDVLDQILLALQGLARADLIRNFPGFNSTQNSRWQRVDDPGVPADSGGATGNLPILWAAPVATWALGDVKFTAMESLFELQSEGAEMAHGVESRYPECVNGTSAIFRIEGMLPSGDAVRATVEYARVAHQRQDDGVDERWRLNEIKGRFNTEVEPALLRVALLALDALNNTG